MPKYTDVKSIENYLLTEIDLSMEEQVENWIDSMEAFIDKYTGRNFKAEETASIKKYDGVCFSCGNSFGTRYASEKEMFIDDCIAVEELKIDGEVIDDDEYLLYPSNELPKTRIKLKDTNSFTFSKGEQNIEVEAKWGYSVEPPKDIVFVATILVAGIINYGKGSNVIRSETIGNYSVTYGDELQWQEFQRALNILDSYKKLGI